ncbi:hypothetical protein [Roseibium sp.]|uniref:hypothetical protein n=1 Tax=Roseibium sp. TaxID=1936156 RepID=UPI00329A7C16
MAASRPKTVSFRLSDGEMSAIKEKAGALSAGDFARRAAFDLSADDRAVERRAIGKAIRAVHVAIADGLSDDKQRVVKALISDALEILANKAPASASDGAE